MLATVHLLCALLVIETIALVMAIALALVALTLLRNHDRLVADRLTPAWAKRWIEAQR